MTDDKLADDIISTLEKLRAENPGDFMAVAEMRNEVLEEAASTLDALADNTAEILLHIGELTAQERRTARASINLAAHRVRRLKSGGKNA